MIFKANQVKLLESNYQVGGKNKTYCHFTLSAWHLMTNTLYWDSTVCSCTMHAYRYPCTKRYGVELLYYHILHYIIISSRMHRHKLETCWNLNSNTRAISAMCLWGHAVDPWRWWTWYLRVPSSLSCAGLAERMTSQGALTGCSSYWHLLTVEILVISCNICNTCACPSLEDFRSGRNRKVHCISTAHFEIVSYRLV